VCIKRNGVGDLEWSDGVKGVGKEGEEWGKGQVFKLSDVMADINHVFQSASPGNRSSAE
jgi:hypothetical protein